MGRSGDRPLPLVARFPHVVYFPHAAIFVDGEMCQFDRDRQPEGPPLMSRKQKAKQDPGTHVEKRAAKRLARKQAIERGAIPTDSRTPQPRRYQKESPKEEPRS